MAKSSQITIHYFSAVLPDALVLLYLVAGRLTSVDEGSNNYTGAWDDNAAAVQMNSYKTKITKILQAKLLKRTESVVLERQEKCHLITYTHSNKHTKHTTCTL